MPVSSGIDQIKADLPLLKKTYQAVAALGPGMNSTEFRLSIENYPDLTFLIQATQVPEFARNMIEAKGPLGIMINEPGTLKNAGDITFTFKEVITGVAYKALFAICKQREMLTITLELCPESSGGAAALTFTLSDAWLEVSATDVSVDDGTTFVKPNGTIHYNWVDLA